jgi:hypothetical protein
MFMLPLLLPLLLLLLPTTSGDGTNTHFSSVHALGLMIERAAVMLACGSSSVAAAVAAAASTASKGGC